MRVLDILSAVGAMAMAATPLAAIGSSAHAADLDRPAVSIRVGDLDLTRPTDVARFDARVTSAASTLCAERGATGLDQWSSCRTAVREEAVEKLGDSQRYHVATLARP